MPNRHTSPATAVILMLALLAVATPPAQAQIVLDRARSEPVYGRAVAVSPTVAVTATSAAAVSRAGDTIIRVHVVIGAPVGAGWAIEVRTSDGAVWTSPPLAAAGTELWSDELGTPDRRPASVTVQLKGPAGSTAPQAAVDRLVVAQDHTTPQAITPPGDQSEAISRGSDRVKAWGKSVARLQFVGDDGGAYYCTAFLVSPDLMLTNNHCISTDAEMKSAIAEFDYDLTAPSETKRFKELILHDQTLDYALLRLVQGPGRAALPVRAAPLTERKALLIIEHPGGKPKRFSRIDCHVRGITMPGMGAANTDFGHFCDTEGGSSGSPIQAFPSGEVIGLHHLGFEQGQPSPVNRGVQIGLVLDDIKQRNPAVRAEIPQP